MLTVLLIRHGQTDWNHTRRIQGGNSNPSLNEEGKRQAACLARKLSRDNIKAVHASPLNRALVTAGAIAGYHQLEVKQDKNFREIDCGTMEGASVKEIGTRLHKLIEGGDENDVLFKQCGGESLTELQARAWQSIREISGQYQEGTVAVVSHYFVISSIICKVLEIPVTDLGKFRLGETSISSIVFREGSRPYLGSFNDRCHLQQ